MILGYFAIIDLIATRSPEAPASERPRTASKDCVTLLAPFGGVSKLPLVDTVLGI